MITTRQVPSSTCSGTMRSLNCITIRAHTRGTKCRRSSEPRSATTLFQSASDTLSTGRHGHTISCSHGTLSRPSCSRMRRRNSSLLGHMHVLVTLAMALSPSRIVAPATSATGQALIRAVQISSFFIGTVARAEEDFASAAITIDHIVDVVRRAPAAMACDRFAVVGD
jgi:hypothetical protein